MADILQDTLSGTTTGIEAPPTPKAMSLPSAKGTNQVEIARLKTAQQKPEALLSLQKAMTASSQMAYRARQAQELEQAGTQFDPTKVSGGTFASIIGNLEQQRGTDISRIYQSTMGTYQAVQKEITNRLQYLQELEESKRRWEAEMKMRKDELDRLKEQDEKAYEMQKERFEMDKKMFELDYNKKSGGSGSGYSSNYLENLTSGFSQITQGTDGYLDPQEFNRWSKDAISNAQTSKDLSTLSAYMTRAKDLLNPRDLTTNAQEVIDPVEQWLNK
jgi:hypothetical protein